MQAFSNYDCGESSPTACWPDDTAVMSHGQEMTSSAGALADEDHVTPERAGFGEDGSCSPSSVTIVDLDATTDGDQGGSAAADRPTTLRVPTPSSWEKYRVAVPATSPSRHPQSAAGEPTADDPVVKVVLVADRRNDLLKDDVDRRSIKKPCSCGAVSADIQVASCLSRLIF